LSYGNEMSGGDRKGEYEKKNGEKKEEQPWEPGELSLMGPHVCE